MPPLYSTPYAQSAHTLPRNFTFHYEDGEAPRTPEPSETSFALRSSPPPAPPARALREPYRLRRRRGPLQASQRFIRATAEPPAEAADQDKPEDVPIPSVEVVDATESLGHIPRFASTWSARRASPPKTPVAQIYESGLDGFSEASSSLEDLCRPSTSSSRSSGISSKLSSVESFPSMDEPCSSPGPDADPFELSQGLMSSPLQDYGLSTTGTLFADNRPTFSAEMDDHLWLTYMRYLQDPTHTPFKMLPGTAPPPGVCSRVVREAKRTWKSRQIPSIPKAYRFARWGSARGGTMTEAGNASASGFTDRRSYIPGPWYRSDSACRRRLRELCKLKPTLSAHYGRLLHARSPSPFTTSSARASSTSEVRGTGATCFGNPAETFSTRDMGISLATSTSSTMQPEHPISQLSSEAAPQSMSCDTVAQFEDHSHTATAQRQATFDMKLPSMPRTPSHQKSYSLHELDTQSLETARLASPFRPLPSQRTAARPHKLIKSSATIGPSFGRSFVAAAAAANIKAPVPRRSFFHLSQSVDSDRTMYSEDSYTRQNQLMHELFGPPHKVRPVEPTLPRARSRGFSLGDMNAASSRLESLFSAQSPPQVPPAAKAPAAGQTPFMQESNLLSVPRDNHIARLGSPFAEKSSKRAHFNTFPRNLSLLGVESAMDISEDPSEVPIISVPPLPGLGQS